MHTHTHTCTRGGLQTAFLHLCLTFDHFLILPVEEHAAAQLFALPSKATERFPSVSQESHVFVYNASTKETKCSAHNGRPSPLFALWMFHCSHSPSRPSSRDVISRDIPASRRRKRRQKVTRIRSRRFRSARRGVCSTTARLMNDQRRELFTQVDEATQTSCPAAGGDEEGRRRRRGGEVIWVPT